LGDIDPIGHNANLTFPHCGLQGVEGEPADSEILQIIAVGFGNFNGIYSRIEMALGHMPVGIENEAAQGPPIIAGTACLL
jgi:hypothetical protein